MATEASIRSAAITDFHAAVAAGCTGRSSFSEDVGGMYWATVIWTQSQHQVVTIGGMSDPMS